MDRPTKIKKIKNFKRQAHNTGFILANSGQGKGIGYTPKVKSTSKDGNFPEAQIRAK